MWRAFVAIVTPSNYPPARGKVLTLHCAFARLWFWASFTMRMQIFVAACLKYFGICAFILIFPNRYGSNPERGAGRPGGGIDVWVWAVFFEFFG